MRRSRTGSKSAMLNSLLVGPSCNRPSPSPRPITNRSPRSTTQLLQRPIDLVGRHIAPATVVDHHRRRSLADADALGKLDGDFAILTGAAGLDIELLTHARQYLLTTEQGTCQPPTHPQARFA